MFNCVQFSFASNFVKLFLQCLLSNFWLLFPNHGMCVLNATSAMNEVSMTRNGTAILNTDSGFALAAVERPSETQKRNSKRSVGKSIFQMKST